MSKKKNGKHISGNPQKRAAQAEERKMQKDRPFTLWKTEVRCDGLLYDRMVEKTVESLKTITIVNNGEYREFTSDSDIKKTIKNNLDDDDLDILASFLWDDSPMRKSLGCDACIIFRPNNTSEFYGKDNFYIGYHGSNLKAFGEGCWKDFDRSKYIGLFHKDFTSFSDKNKIGIFLKVGRELLKMRETGDCLNGLVA